MEVVKKSFTETFTVYITHLYFSKSDCIRSFKIKLKLITAIKSDRGRLRNKFRKLFDEASTNAKQLFHDLGSCLCNKRNNTGNWSIF